MGDRWWPGRYLRFKALLIICKQGSAGFFKADAVASHCSHETIGAFVGGSLPIFFRMAAPSLIDQSS